MREPNVINVSLALVKSKLALSPLMYAWGETKGVSSLVAFSSFCLPPWEKVMSLCMYVCNCTSSVTTNPSVSCGRWARRPEAAARRSRRTRSPGAATPPSGSGSGSGCPGLVCRRRSRGGGSQESFELENKIHRFYFSNLVHNKPWILNYSNHI